MRRETTEIILSPVTRFVVEIETALNKTFIEAGKELLQTKNPAEIAKVKKRARRSIQGIIKRRQEKNGREIVSVALKELHLEEFDT